MLAAPRRETDVGDLVLRDVPCSCGEPLCVTSMIVLGDGDWWMLASIDFGQDRGFEYELGLLAEEGRRDAGRRLVAAFGHPWEELSQKGLVAQARAIHEAGRWLPRALASLDVEALAGLRQWIGTGNDREWTLPALKALHDYIGAVD